MRTLNEVATVLETERKRQRVTYDDLARSAGLTPVSTRRALQAVTAPKVTTLMALADRLGLEVVLLPKAVAAGFQATPAAPAPALTAVDKLLRRPA